MNPKHLAATLFLTGALSSPAMAADEALVSYQMLSPETALELAKAAMKSCQKAGYQVAIAIVDRMGTTQVILRDRYAGPHTPETARRKAWTAVSFRTDTLSLADLTKAGTPQSGARFVSDALMLGGGVPVEVGGSMVGGVGVSGAPGGKQDDDCARDGIKAVQDKLEL